MSNVSDQGETTVGRKILMGLICAAAVVTSHMAVGQANISAEMQMMKSAEKHGAFIDRFAKFARDRNETEALAALDPESIKGISEEQLRIAMNNDFFPFFAQYEKLKNYEQVTKAQAADGRIGLWHYTFIVDAQGNVKPFQIAIIDSGAGLKVLSILVGQCVKGRHPAIPPCN